MNNPLNARDPSGFVDVESDAPVPEIVITASRGGGPGDGATVVRGNGGGGGIAHAFISIKAVTAQDLADAGLKLQTSLQDLADSLPNIDPGPDSIIDPNAPEIVITGHGPKNIPLEPGITDPLRFTDYAIYLAPVVWENELRAIASRIGASVVRSIIQNYKSPEGASPQLGEPGTWQVHDLIESSDFLGELPSGELVYGNSGNASQAFENLQTNAALSSVGPNGVVGATLPGGGSVLLDGARMTINTPGMPSSIITFAK